MSFFRKLLVFSLLVAPLATAHASEIIGQGTTRCEKFLKLTELNDQVEDTFMNWAEGYVSGLAFDRSAHGVEVDASIFLFHYSYDKEKIRQFCQRSPQSSYKDAVHHTLLELLQDQGADIGKDEQFKLN
ncbi:hypothetical protein [Acetobacter orientalis]|uniref:hypothetical protein n=1 Tax=Acetobacter orientalis TaxID=146474 RepID=UPI0039EAA465